MIKLTISIESWSFNVLFSDQLKKKGKIKYVCISRPTTLYLAPGLGPGPRPRHPTLAPNLYLPALAPTLCLPALAANLYLPVLAPNLYLSALTPTLCLRHYRLSLMPEFAYTDLVSPVCICWPCLRFVRTQAAKLIYPQRCLII